MPTTAEAFEALERELEKNRAEIKAAEVSKARIWQEVQTSRAAANKELLELKAETQAERERILAGLPELREQEKHFRTIIDELGHKITEARGEAEKILKDADRIHRCAEAEAQKFMDEKRKVVDELRVKYHAFKQALPESL